LGSAFGALFLILAVILFFTFGHQQSSKEHPDETECDTDPGLSETPEYLAEGADVHQYDNPLIETTIAGDEIFAGGHDETSVLQK
jgi:hypothetical protein